LNRNKENVSFRERYSSKATDLEKTVNRMKREHKEYVDGLSTQLEQTALDRTSLDKSLLEERRIQLEISTKLQEESRQREMNDLKIQELSELLKRSKEDTSLLVNKLQDDISTERNVCFVVYELKLLNFNSKHLLDASNQFKHTLAEKQSQILQLEANLRESQRNIEERNIEISKWQSAIETEKKRTKSNEERLALEQQDRLRSEGELALSHEKELSKVRREWEEKYRSLEKEKKRVEDEVEAKVSELANQKLTFSRKMQEMEGNVREEEVILFRFTIIIAF
jgi:chromosome segregation ATPase